MKSLIIVFLLAFTTTCFAQNPASQDDVQKQRALSVTQMAAAATEVGVVEKDVVKLKATFEDLFKKVELIKADSTLTPEAKKEKLKAANAEKDFKVKYILGDKMKAYTEVRKRLISEAEKKEQRKP